MPFNFPIALIIFLNSISLLASIKEKRADVKMLGKQPLYASNEVARQIKTFSNPRKKFRNFRYKAPFYNEKHYRVSKEVKKPSFRKVHLDESRSSDENHIRNEDDQILLKSKLKLSKIIFRKIDEIEKVYQIEGTENLTSGIIEKPSYTESKTVMYKQNSHKKGKQNHEKESPLKKNFEKGKKTISHKRPAASRKPSLRKLIQELQNFKVTTVSHQNKFNNNMRIHGQSPFANNQTIRKMFENAGYKFSNSIDSVSQISAVSMAPSSHRNYFKNYKSGKIHRPSSKTGKITEKSRPSSFSTATASRKDGKSNFLKANDKNIESSSKITEKSRPSSSSTVTASLKNGKSNFLKANDKNMESSSKTGKITEKSHPSSSSTATASFKDEKSNFLNANDENMELVLVETNSSMTDVKKIIENDWLDSGLKRSLSNLTTRSTHSETASESEDASRITGNYQKERSYESLIKSNSSLNSYHKVTSQLPKIKSMVTSESSEVNDENLQGFTTEIFGAELTEDEEPLNKEIVITESFIPEIITNNSQ